MKTMTDIRLSACFKLLMAKINNKNHSNSNLIIILQE